MDRLAVLHEVTPAHAYHEERWVGEGPDRHQEPTDKVSYVHLGLSSSNWCQLGMRDGDYYMGGCCGNMSAAQDIVNGAFRDGGGIDGADLLQLGQLCEDHDGFEDWKDGLEDDEFVASCNDWADIDPWRKLGMAYHTVKDHLLPRTWDKPRPVEELDANQQFNVLRNTLERLTWDDMFTRDDPRHREQYESGRLVTLSRLLPALRAVLKAVEGEQRDFTGYALVEPESGRVHSNAWGLCVYRTEALAQGIIDLWAKADREAAEDGRAREPLRASITPCRITLGEGLVLL